MTRALFLKAGKPLHKRIQKHDPILLPLHRYMCLKIDNLSKVIHDLVLINHLIFLNSLHNVKHFCRLIRKHHI
ncbi:hypothetical protein M8C21_027447 [Ambrosia artemisiifolia]|uniref:Uncharacterized protein n=1 Tax=Ambrosia artemisiifolia TaxID=4212 RepID=A0AAD5CJL7_AMBAR|nr:hypothetical protein M8C21_027447 [Ambrosia artemisiifolia]